ncbi:glycosyl hydrolase [uncultured Schumannella sp.]|uniref:glycosyl hydrolase n=1 Tax=uncultured Schumannella sp. TaxID=1195956 RepID=UPI0025F809FF|nr:glycosyl hydrolase [uncultured Schumannella sp.]
MNRARLAIRSAVAILATLVIVAAGATGAASAAVVQTSTIPSWNSYSNGGAQLTVGVDTVNKHGGSAALKIEHTSARAGNSYGGVAQPLTIAPSTTYTISGWVKAQSVQGNDANLIILNQSWTEARYFTGGTYGWTAFTWTFTSAADQTVMPFMLVGQDTGTLWLDDLSMTAAGSTTNLLANSAFETYSDRVTVTNTKLVFAPGAATVNLVASSSTVGWNVADQNGAIALQGIATVSSSGTASINLNALPAGYYALRMQGGTFYTETSLAVVTGLATAPTASTNPFGTTSHPDYEPGLDTVTPLKDAGLASVRFDLRWESIEPTAGNYVFTNPVNYPALVASLNAQGIRPLVVLGFANPLYDGGVRPYTAAGRTAYANYAAAVAQQFGTTVDYEIYNEYNHPGGYYLGTCGASVTCYRQMLAVAAPAIKAVAPSAQIVLTGMAGITSWWAGGDTTGHPEVNFIARDWLDAFLSSPEGSLVDVINMHNYSFPAAPEGQNETAVAAVKAVMAAHTSSASKPLWLTETGWPTMNGTTGTNTEAEQARYLVRDAALSLKAGVNRYMLYDLFNDYEEETPEGRFGIYRNPDSNPAVAPKPAMVTQAVMARQLSGYTVVSADSLGTGVYSIVFQNSAGAKKRIMWATSPATVALSTTGAVTQTSLYGSTSTLTPESGTATVQLGADPIYVNASNITAVAVRSSALYSATAPAQSLQSQNVPITVSVDLRGGGSATGAVTFTGPGSSTVTVTPVAGQLVQGTLSAPAYPEAGAKSIPVTVTRSSATRASLSAMTTVVENPRLSARPATSATGAGPLQLLIDYPGTSGVTVSQIEYSVGAYSATITPGSAVSATATTVVDLPIAGVGVWGPLYYNAKVTFSNGVVKTTTGTTSFSPVRPDGTTNPPHATLGSSARWVSVGGADGGATDHSGAMWLSYGTSTITVHAEITDDAHQVGPAADTLWQGDSIQFAFSEDGPTAASPVASFGAALLASGPVVYRFSGTAGVVSSATATITRTGTTTSYTIVLPRTETGVAAAANRFTYSFLLNDADGSGRDGYLEWGSGIGNVAGPTQYVPMYTAP